jgi:hypothetical protein
MEKCIIGEKCYFDSFSGLIKCIVTDIFPDNTLIIQITGNTKNYKKGEKIRINTLHIIPRRFYHKTGLFTFVVYSDYIWVKG